jgi:hypothetical protein
MGFEDLSHTPEFELPANAPAAPPDLISLVEECHMGLHKAIVQKMVRRGKYEAVATVMCQENPSKKTSPMGSAEDISDYCMMLMQYEAEKSDDPGRYKVTLYGPPGRGRFERSKHVDLAEGDSPATITTTMSEQEFVTSQTEYIGEMHQTVIAMMETVMSLTKTTLSENKELTKVVSDAARKQGDIEREKLVHELHLKQHADEMKLEQEREEAKAQRWKEGLDAIKDSNAIDLIAKGLGKKFMGATADGDEDSEASSDESGEDASGRSDKDNGAAEGGSDVEFSSEKPGEKSKRARGISSGKVVFKKGVPVKRSSSRGSKATKAIGPRAEATRLSPETEKAIREDRELTDEQASEIFLKSGEKQARENPLCLSIKMFKMTIDERDQWPLVKETLSEEQVEILKEMNEAKDDKSARALVKKLYSTKGIVLKMMKLRGHMDSEQKKYADALMSYAGIG